MRPNSYRISIRVFKKHAQFVRNSRNSILSVWHEFIATRNKCFVSLSRSYIISPQPTRSFVWVRFLRMRLCFSRTFNERIQWSRKCAVHSIFATFPYGYSFHRQCVSDLKCSRPWFPENIMEHVLQRINSLKSTTVRSRTRTCGASCIMFHCIRVCTHSSSNNSIISSYFNLSHQHINAIIMPGRFIRNCIFTRSMYLMNFA